MKTFIHPTSPCLRRRPAPRAFSLVEVLVAIGILGLGLIMVACIFPVGADWTRQNADETNATQIARNAVALIQTKYALADLATVTSTVQAIPGLNQNAVAADMPKLTIYERGFQLSAPYLAGGAPAAWPYPSIMAKPTVNDNGSPTTAQFFWTALIRLTPGPAANRQYDLYILVSRKGDAKQTFYGNPSASPAGTPLFLANSLGMYPGSDMPSGTPAATVYSWNGNNYTFGSTRVRSLNSANTIDEYYVPPVLVGVWNPIVTSSDIKPGWQGIGLMSGTVFRCVPNGVDNNNNNLCTTNVVTATNSSTTNGLMVTNGQVEPVAYVPPADNTTSKTPGSPLVYIYQTKLSF